MSAPGRDPAITSRINFTPQEKSSTVSKNVAVFVDVANLYYSARGQEVDVDYVALLKAATKGRDLIRAYAYSGLDPENENQRKFIDFLNKNGYKVVHKDIRKFGDGRVKANLDIELVVDLFRLAYRMDIAVIVSGDGDFAPAIRALQDGGVRCEVISFRPNTSSDLIAVADEFIDIMKIASIGRGKGAAEAAAVKGMSAPPMPAKEVVPEFGFREASPTVAAAALAALKEGKNGRPSNGRTVRGRGRGRSAAASEEAPDEAAAPTTTVDDQANGDEPRGRRRRRRGGRGRGRGNRPEGAMSEASGTATEPPAEPSEIGWTELDDISQIEELVGAGPLTDEGGDEREYTFEEADEATLAELGLLDGSAPTEAGEEPASEEPKPRRRTRTRTAEPKAAAAVTSEDEAPKPARRSRPRKASSEEAGSSEAVEAKPAAKPRTRRTRATASATEPASGQEPEAAKPARRTRTRKPAAAASTEDAAGGEGAEEGIWQRFRSARRGGGSSAS
jgi:uncharacterized LabA/DUF88 family protein